MSFGQLVCEDASCVADSSWSNMWSDLSPWHLGYNSESDVLDNDTKSERKISILISATQGRRSTFRIGGGGGKSKKNLNIFGAPQNLKLCMFSSNFMLNLMVL